MAKKEKEEGAMDVRVEIEESARRGEYCNFVRIQHTAMDFRFDFARAVPDENLLTVHTRLFMSPIHAKMFMKAIEDNILKYERQFGTIELNVSENMPVDTTGTKITH